MEGNTDRRMGIKMDRDRETLIYRNLSALAGGPIKHLPTFSKD